MPGLERSRIWIVRPLYYSDMFSLHLRSTGEDFKQLREVI